MATRLVDTNIVSYFFKGHTLATSYRPLLVGHTLAVCFMTEAELFEGAHRAHWARGGWPGWRHCLRLSCTFPPART